MPPRGKTDDEKPSMQNVASYAGVSIATVSKVMQGVSTVKKENVIAVQNAIEALGYRINPLAAELRRGKRSVLGCIVPDFSDPFSGALLVAMEAAAEKKNYSLQVVSSAGSVAREGELAVRMEDLRVAGALLLPCSRNSEIAATVMADAGLAVATIGLAGDRHTVDSIDLDLSAGKLDAILASEKKAGLVVFGPTLLQSSFTSSIVKAISGKRKVLSLSEFLCLGAEDRDRDAVLIDFDVSDNQDFGIHVFDCVDDSANAATDASPLRMIRKIGTLWVANREIAERAVASLLRQINTPGTRVENSIQQGTFVRTDSPAPGNSLQPKEKGNV